MKRIEPMTTSKQPAKKPKAHANGLIGMFGHTFEDGKFKAQFRVERWIDDQHYVVRIFEQNFGYPAESRVYSLDEIKDAKLYSSEEAWREEGDAMHERARRRREDAEPVLKRERRDSEIGAEK
jgi:hypothetical protein